MVPDLAGLVLFATLAVAGVRKAVAVDDWSRQLVAYSLPRPLRRVSVVGVPWLEIGVAGGGLLVAARPAAGVAVVLLAAFTVAILRLRRLVGHDEVPCACFGSQIARDYRRLVARNVALAALGVTVLLGDDGGLVDAPDALVVGVLLVGLVLAGGWTVRLVRRRGDTVAAGAGS